MKVVISTVPIVDKQKNDLGENLPIQDWQEYTFDVDTVIPPQLIFIKNDFKGMRLNTIHYTVDQHGTIQYRIKGSVYGNR